jgi:hypothetical protein
MALNVEHGAYLKPRDLLNKTLILATPRMAAEHKSYLRWQVVAAGDQALVLQNIHTDLQHVEPWIDVRNRLALKQLHVLED